MANKEAYYTIYYKTIESAGHTWRVDIQKRDISAPQAVEIGAVLQGLRLYVQGEQADIDTPIVKTSLEITFVDAPDLEEGKKCGGWEVLYTSDATAYKVILYKDGNVEWTGYITPDSYSENLQYRGSVSLVARDNLGALNDYEYDGAAGIEGGLVTLRTLLDAGLEKVSFPMQLVSRVSGGVSRHRMHTDSDDIRADLQLLNNGAFVGQSWLEVIEKVLYATGMTLRYVGKNTFILAPICDIPLMDKYYHMDVPLKEFYFSAYGHRELSPALKKIKESIQYDIQENLIDPYMPNVCYGDEQTYQYGSTYSSEFNDDLPVHNVVSGLFRVLDDGKSNLLNVFAYPVNGRYAYGTGGEIQDPKIVYVASNYRHSKGETGFRINIPAGKYTITFDVNKAIGFYDDKKTIGYLDTINNSDFYWRFGYKAQFVGNDGTIKTLNNRAGTTVTQESWEDVNSNGYVSLEGNEFPVAVESAELVTKVAGVLTVKLYHATMPMVLPESRSSRGGYIGIANFAVNSKDNGGNSINDILNINTNYENSNNIILSRASELAPNTSNLISTTQVMNGMYVKRGGKYVGAEDWVFNKSGIPCPLPVLIHQQILAYGAKPNNILTGDIIAQDADFASLWLWKGKKHLLTSGRLNILNGQIENAILKEYIDYDYMWGVWVDKDKIEIDGRAQSMQIRISAKDEFTIADIHILASWLIYESLELQDSGAYLLTIAAQATNERRTGSLLIGNREVFIIQNAI